MKKGEQNGSNHIRIYTHTHTHTSSRFKFTANLCKSLEYCLEIKGVDK